MSNISGWNVLTIALGYILGVLILRLIDLLFRGKQP